MWMRLRDVKHRFESRSSPSATEDLRREPPSVTELGGRLGICRDDSSKKNVLAIGSPDNAGDAPSNANSRVIPILLLKTKSSPTDVYEDYFANLDGPFLSANKQKRYRPQFVPVLEHRLIDSSLQWLFTQLDSGAFTRQANGGAAKYGGIMFTSQRAVEAWARVTENMKASGRAWDKLLPSYMPHYVVGPATAKALKALKLGCTIAGQETGNGEALARFILGHYNRLYQRVTMGHPPKPPLLFLVGEQRRDIIPKTLQSPLLSAREMIQVEEVVVYETGVMPSFTIDFERAIERNIEAGHQLQWVVIFSPTGCKTMLETLGYLDEKSGKALDALRDPKHLKKLANGLRNVFVATIGPTTRDYLIDEFDMEPDVCAEKPNEMALGYGITMFMQDLTLKELGQTREDVEGDERVLRQPTFFTPPPS